MLLIYVVPIFFIERHVMNVMVKKTFRDQLQWQALILAQQQSGLNISTYCSKHKLSTSSFLAQLLRELTS